MQYKVKLLLILLLIMICGIYFPATKSYAQISSLPSNNLLNQQEASYDDVMNITLESKLSVDVIIKKVKRLPPTQTINVASNKQRILITAEVQSLIRGTNHLNREIKFLFDAPIDSRGKIPKLKKQRIFAFGFHVANRPDFIRLAHKSSILLYSANKAALVRSITKEVLENDAPQKITGVSSAFHSAGTIIGDGETQIFLDTEFGQPMAISVVSKRRESKRWSVSTSEVIDINASEPIRNSLLGYRIACNLPKAIKPAVIETNDTIAIRKTIEDYNFIQAAIGPCQRNIIWK